MSLALVCSIIIFSFGAVAIFMGKSALGSAYRDNRTNRLLGIAALMSAIWSYGFGLVFVTTNISVAYWGRLVGMIGVFGYLIAAPRLITSLANVPELFKKYVNGFSLLGILIYPFTVNRNAVQFFVDAEGMTYKFLPGMANNIYTAYSVIVGINIITLIIIMIKRAENRRSRFTAKKMLLAALFIIGGMVLDTIFPLVGLAAIPGSTFTQFLGVVVMFYAIVDANKTHITMLNMSTYISTFVSEFVMVFDINGHLKLMNESAKDAYTDAFHRMDTEDVSISAIFDVDDDFLSYEENGRKINTYSVSGNVPVSIESNKIKDKYGDLIGHIVTIKDMSEIKRMMDSLRNAKAEAEDANCAKSLFLANMSHEIRTPLNAIVGFSELLIKDGTTPQGAEQAEDIRTSAQNLLAIINDILDISKIESGRMELVEDNYSSVELFRDVYLIIKNQAERHNLKFTASIDENIPAQMIGDAPRVRGVLVNVLNNAVKYTKEGFVSIKAVCENIDEQSMEAVLRFDISDSGIGIKQEDIPKLFDSFAQVDKKKNQGIEGTGLGLAIVKGYVELMKGKVEVSSVLGEGSTFTIYITQKMVSLDRIGHVDFAGRKGETAKSNIGDVKFTGAKILAVDDTKLNLKLLVKALASYDIDIDTAISGQEAIDKCAGSQYDIVLMDQMMPVMDGVTAMKEIRKLSDFYAAGGACKIVALTANAINGAKEELLAEGFDDYLSKPIDFAKLNEMFIKYLKEEVRE